ncbi:MAG: transcriptional repressor [Sporomusaceae bacterium]|nr:transcriptional repressor [Sporomusaceae bacterium]
METSPKPCQVRVTKQRQAILRVISDSRGHLTADDIFQEVRRLQPNISLGTIYRNLELLTQAGDLAKSVFSDGKARFEFAGGHHHHLICLGCGCAVDIPVCPVGSEVTEFIARQNFQACHHHFEIYGYCALCAPV